MLVPFRYLYDQPEAQHHLCGSSPERDWPKVTLPLHGHLVHLVLSFHQVCQYPHPLVYLVEAHLVFFALVEVSPHLLLVAASLH